MGEIKRESFDNSADTFLQNPKVSVIIPIYNVEAYLKRSLGSVVNQTLKDIEIICVVDGNKDKCKEISQSYAQQDKRFKLIFDINKGLGGARNAGVEAACGEYLAFIDSDDYIDPNYLEELYKAAKENNADIACASIIRKREHAQKWRVHYLNQTVIESTQKKADVCDISIMNYVWNKIYRRESFLKSGIVFEENFSYEDVVFTIRILKALGKLVTVPNVNYYYWANKTSSVKRVPGKKQQEDYYKANINMIKFADENGIKISEKVRHIVKKRYYFFNVLILKAKEYRFKTTYYLFGFIPLFSITQYPNIRGELC